MEKITYTALVLLICLSGLGLKKTDVDINIKMKQLGESIEDLFPYMYSTTKFTSSKNHKFIEKRLTNIRNSLSAVKGHINRKSIGYKISYELIVHHVDEAKNHFQKNNKIYAQDLVKDIPSLCISCHVQNNVKRKLFKDFGKSSFFSDFEFAEFSYLTRDYTNALSSYRRVILLAKDRQKVEKSLERQLSIFTEGEKDTVRAIKYFNEYLNNKKLPKYVHRYARDWIKSLKKWESDKNFRKKYFNKKNINIFVKKYIDTLDGDTLVFTDEQRAIYMRFAHLLYGYLNKGAGKDTPKILYWLAVADKKLHFNSLYSIGNLYLLECMKSYQDDPYAKKCFEEFKQNTILSFTGSSGIDKKEVKLELNKLKKFVPNRKLMDWDKWPADQLRDEP